MSTIEQLAQLRIDKCNKCPLKKDTSILGISTTICDTETFGEVVVDFFYKEINQYRKKGDTYRGCGCSLALKPFSQDTQCPLGKWEDLLAEK